MEHWAYAFVGGALANLVAQLLIAHFRKQLSTKLEKPSERSKHERDPYFNREYARPAAPPRVSRSRQAA